MADIPSLPNLTARASASDISNLSFTSSTAPPVTYPNDDWGGRCTLAVSNVRHQNVDLSMTLSFLGSMTGVPDTMDSQGNVTRYAAVMDFNAPLKTTGPCCCKSETDLSDTDLTVTNVKHRVSRNRTIGHKANACSRGKAKEGNALRFSNVTTKLQERAGSCPPRKDRLGVAKGAVKFNKHPSRFCKQNQGKLNRLDNQTASLAVSQGDNKKSASCRKNPGNEEAILKTNKILVQDESTMSDPKISSSNNALELVDESSNDSDDSCESDYSTDKSYSRTIYLQDGQVHSSAETESGQKEAHTETPGQSSLECNDSVSKEASTEETKSTFTHANTKSWLISQLIPPISPSICQTIAELSSESSENVIPQSHSNTETAASSRHEKESPASPSSPKSQEACKDLIRAFLQVFYSAKADTNAPDEIQETQQTDEVNNAEKRSTKLPAKSTDEKNTLSSDTRGWERNGKDIQSKPQNKHNNLSYQNDFNMPASGKPAGITCPYKQNDGDKISNKLQVDMDKKTILKECPGIAEDKNYPSLLHQTEDKIGTASEKESRCGKQAKKTVIVRIKRTKNGKQIQENTSARNAVNLKQNRYATLGTAKHASFDTPGNSIKEIHNREHPSRRERARSVAERRKRRQSLSPISLNVGSKPEQEVIEILKKRTLQDFSSKRDRAETKKDSCCKNSPSAEKKHSKSSGHTAGLDNSQNKLLNVEDKGRFIKRSHEKMVSEKSNSSRRSQTLVVEKSDATVESNPENCPTRPSPEQSREVDSVEAPSTNVLSDTKNRTKRSDSAALKLGERTYSFINKSEQEEGQGNSNVLIAPGSVPITRSDVTRKDSSVTSCLIKPAHKGRKLPKEVQKNPKLVIGFIKLSPDARTSQLRSETSKNSHTEPAKSSGYDNACNKLRNSQLTTAKEEEDEHEKLLRYICDHNSSIASAKDSVALLENKAELNNEDLIPVDVSKNTQSTTIMFSRVLKQTYVESGRSFFSNDDKEQEMETVEDVSSFNERSEICSVKRGHWSAEESKGHHSNVTVLQGEKELEDASKLRSPGLRCWESKQRYGESKNTSLQAILVDSAHTTQNCSLGEISSDASFDRKMQEMLQSGEQFSESNEQCMDGCDVSRVMLEAAHSVFSIPKGYQQYQSRSAQKQLHFRESHASPERAAFSKFITTEGSPSPRRVIYKEQGIDNVKGKENTEPSKKQRIIRSSAFTLMSGPGRGGVTSPVKAVQNRTDCEVTENLSFKKTVRERGSYTNSPKFKSSENKSAFFNKTEEFSICQESSPLKNEKKKEARARISTNKHMGYKRIFVTKSNDKMTSASPRTINPQTTRQACRGLQASAGQKATPVHKSKDAAENVSQETVNIDKQDRELKQSTERTVVDHKITSHAVCASDASEASKLLIAPPCQPDSHCCDPQPPDKQPASNRGEKQQQSSLFSNNSDKLSCEVVNSQAACTVRNRVQEHIQSYTEMQGQLYNSCAKNLNHSIRQKRNIFDVGRVGALCKQTKDRIYNIDVDNYQDAPLDLSMKSQTSEVGDQSIFLGSLPGNNMSNSGTWHESVISSHFPVQGSPLNLSKKSNSGVGFHKIAESDLNGSNYGTILNNLPITKVSISSQIVEPTLSSQDKTSLQIDCYNYDESIASATSVCQYYNTGQETSELNGRDRNHELTHPKNEAQSRFGKDFPDIVQSPIEHGISPQVFERFLFISSGGASSVLDRTFEPKAGPSCFSSDSQQEQRKASNSLRNLRAIEDQDSTFTKSSFCNASNPDIATKYSGVRTVRDSKYSCSKISNRSDIQPSSDSCSHNRPVHDNYITTEQLERKELKIFASGDSLQSTGLSYGDRSRQPTACKGDKQEELTRCLKSCTAQEELTRCLKSSTAQEDLTRCLKSCTAQEELTRCLKSCTAQEELTRCLKSCTAQKELICCLKSCTAQKDMSRCLKSCTAKEGLTHCLKSCTAQEGLTHCLKSCTAQENISRCLKSCTAQEELTRCLKSCTAQEELTRCLKLSTAQEELTRCLKSCTVQKELTRCLKSCTAQGDLTRCLKSCTAQEELTRCLKSCTAQEELTRCLKSCTAQEELTRCLKLCTAQEKHHSLQTNSYKTCSEHKDYKRSNFPVRVAEKKQLEVKQVNGRNILQGSQPITQNRYREEENLFLHSPAPDGNVLDKLAEYEHDTRLNRGQEPKLCKESGMTGFAPAPTLGLSKTDGPFSVLPRFAGSQLADSNVSSLSLANVRRAKHESGVSQMWKPVSHAKYSAFCEDATSSEYLPSTSESSATNESMSSVFEASEQASSTDSYQSCVSAFGT